MKMFIYISPIMIVFISMSSMAALPLYWSVSGALLIIQTYIGRKYYSEHPEKAKNKLIDVEAPLLPRFFRRTAG